MRNNNRGQVPRLNELRNLSPLLVEGDSRVDSRLLEKYEKS